MTAIVFIVETERGEILKVLMMAEDSFAAKLSAANAEPKKPARVIPIWIVERKRVGSSAYGTKDTCHEAARFP